MNHFDFYTKKYGIKGKDDSFEKFLSLLKTYYSGKYYVDWGKAFNNARRYEEEFALLSTLCKKPDRLQAAKNLLKKYPQVIPSLPLLIACRDTVSLADDSLVNVEVYDFKWHCSGMDEQVEKYARFLVDSGLIDLLEHIQVVNDYALGIEVGMDTNARKNRSGELGVQAILPWVKKAAIDLESIGWDQEVDAEKLQSLGCKIPSQFSDIIWDFAFWNKSVEKRKFVVMETNHYGSTGSKPSAIAREYAARQKPLDDAKIGFIWATDGMAWREMKNPLREAFLELDWIVNVQLAADGMLNAALHDMLMS